MKEMTSSFHRSWATALLVAIACGKEAPKAASTEATDSVDVQDLISQLSCAPSFNKFIGPPPAGVLPFVPLASLKTVANPVVTFTNGVPDVRGDLSSYVANAAAAIQLGKALFWEMQAGSDNKVACATCHFQGGQDTRTKNTLNPGFNGTFDGLSTNYSLTAANFPFVDPALSRNVDNIAGSQGVRKSTFVSIGTTGVETTTPGSDPTFGSMRQVTGVNAPSTINAVYNHRNFFNGRAQNDFNGIDPFGSRNPNAHIWYASSSTTVSPLAVTITNAALASQAVGPPLNPVEMSADGRTFPDLGKKLLLLKPLGLQKVDARDGVLGALADTKAGKGLKTTYAAMIQKAFQPSLWNSTGTVTLNNKAYTLTQANFSFIWGMAIMLYEATLVADNSPMDQYVATRTFDAAGNLTASNPALLDAVVNRLAAEGTTIPLAAGGSRAVTRADILLGIDLFEKPIPPPTVVGLPPGSGVGCNACHLSAETTSASVRSVTVGVEAGDVAFKNLGFDLRMERMFMGVRDQPFTAPQPPPPVPFGTDVITYDNSNYSVTVNSINGTPVAPQAVTVNTYDVGWYDIGIRPIVENPGLGGLDAFGNPLSWTQYFQTVFATPQNTFKVAGGGLTCIDANGNPVAPPAAPLGSPFVGEVMDPGINKPIISGGLLKTESTDVAGTFKTPQLRNVELNGPYFHSGGKSTLRQVVEFYDDGGNFPNATLSPLIRPLALTDDQKAALVAFLIALTDDRVRLQQAPFDHPELVVPAGQDASGNDLTISVAAVGAGGSVTPAPRFLGLNPFQP
ncbi:MAG TPA: cytochrome c peroxidase [Myxococcales bacterium]|nr:cytochrome c peroxidase [Myxococcales bacterium]